MGKKSYEVKPSTDIIIKKKDDDTASFRNLFSVTKNTELAELYKSMANTFETLENSFEVDYENAG